MSAVAQPHRTVSVRSAFIAYGAPAIAILVYLTWWPAGLHTVLTRHQPVGLHGPLWTYPFNDLDAVLWSLDCERQGVDVTLPDTCLNGGLFQYSPLLLKAAILPIGRAQRVPLGLGIDTIFLLSLYALPRPRRWREFWSLLLAALSYSTVWALESANVDVALYLLVLLAVYLLLRGAGLRAAGYATILVAAAIKFYPACLLVLAARERPLRLAIIALASLAGAVLFSVAFASQLGHILPRLPHIDPFRGSFFAHNLPDGLALLLSGNAPDSDLGRAIRLLPMPALIIFCTLSTWRWMPTLLPALRTMAPRQRMLLVAGAATMTFCFVATQNFLYRQIFLILTLPGLWDMERRGPDPAFSARVRLACWVVCGLMWSFFFQTLSVAATEDGPDSQAALMAIVTAWLVRELLWWWLIGLFAAIILCFLWDSPALGHWRAQRQTRSAGRPRLRIGAGD